jgi:hypothetical protein
MTRPAEPQLVVELKTGAVGLVAVDQEAAGLPAQVGLRQIRLGSLMHWPARTAPASTP